MVPWGQAMKIFVFGFSGVFITLAILVLAINILGRFVKIFATKKSPA